MAIEPLSQHLIDAGAQVRGELDKIGLTPQGVLWLHFHHLNDWRLTVVSDLVDEIGRRKVYSLISEAVEGLKPVDGLSVFDIHLAATNEILPRVLGGAFRVADGLATLVDCNINGMPVDAVIYRLGPSRSPREVKAAAKKFERLVKEGSRQRMHA